MTKTPLNIPPRGLNIRQAAAYWGVSPGTYKKLMKLGLVPPPLELPGCDRNIFDKEAIDRAMDVRSGNAIGDNATVDKPETATATSWDDV